VVGRWYPGEPGVLARAVDGYVNAAEVEHEDSTEAATSRTPHDRLTGCPRALIAPHAGLMYSGPVAAYGYRQVTGCRYSSVVLVGPSHFVPFDGIAAWSRGCWETPFGSVPIDEELTSAIAARTRDIRDYPEAHAKEHSLEMQMPFLAHLLPHVPIVALVMGYQTRATCDGLASALSDAIAIHERTRDPVLLLASSDLSHYHDAPAARRLDAVVLRSVDALDPEGLMQALEQQPDHACGGGPMVSVLLAAQRLGASRGRVLRYADSGDVSGDKSSVVGYMAAGIW
jgi:AmmeMemoRadiSam system protein B